jgi:hypothetical protein
MTHLSRDECVRLAEAPGDAGHPHLAECERCRAEVRALRTILARVRAADVPEPSPLFWDHFSARVAERVRAEGTGERGAWRGWRRWRVAVPIAVGAAAVVLAFVVGGHGANRPAVAPAALLQAPVATATASDAGAVEDEQWQMLSHLAGDFDLETVSDSIGAPGRSGADAAVWDLSDRERAELGRLLREELQTAPSGS